MRAGREGGKVGTALKVGTEAQTKSAGWQDLADALTVVAGLSVALLVTSLSRWAFLGAYQAYGHASSLGLATDGLAWLALGYDTSGLGDLYRVLSFLGLGASLLVLAWLYQRFVFRPLAGSGPV